MILIFIDFPRPSKSRKPTIFLWYRKSRFMDKEKKRFHLISHPIVEA